MARVQRVRALADSERAAGPLLGSPGRLAILAWTMALLLLNPAGSLIWSAGLTLGLNAVLYPASFRRLLRWRWLLFAVFLIIPNLLWSGEADRSLLGVPISMAGLMVGLGMLLRSLIILVAVDGLSGTVGISEFAGLFERLGLSGLGFSLGVAFNLLPSIRQSSQRTWYSLRMRGGFRARWRRAIRLFLVTVISNALRDAEDIALAAEVRAFSPELARSLPVRRGSLDWPVMIGALGSWLALYLVR
jgi:energy-coupling factor transporter transmembrane protein EcfT